MTTETFDQLIKEHVNKSSPKSSEAEKAQLVEVIKSVLEGKKTLAEALNFPKDQLEFIYGYAVDLYKGAKYSDAAKGFNYLMQLNAADPRFAFAYAAALHKMKDYFRASYQYTVAAGLNKEDPRPWFHAADCYVHMSQLIMAKTMLENAILVAGDKAEHQKIRKDAEALLEITMQQIASTLS